MNSTAFSPPSKSSSKIDGNQIIFGAVDFQPHPPTLALVFANLDQEMDLTIGSFNFHVRSLGHVRLSDHLGPSAGKTATPTSSKTSVRSSSEVKLGGQGWISIVTSKQSSLLAQAAMSTTNTHQEKTQHHGT
jgi:hypothetical protein